MSASFNAFFQIVAFGDFTEWLTGPLDQWRQDHPLIEITAGVINEDPDLSNACMNNIRGASFKEDYYALYMQVQPSPHFISLQCCADNIVTQEVILLKSLILLKQLADKGAAGFHDRITQNWFSPGEFLKTLPENNQGSLTGQLQVLSFLEENEIHCWMYTLGMRKLGLPDLSIHNVSPGLTQNHQCTLKNVCQIMIEQRNSVPDKEILLQNRLEMAENKNGFWELKNIY